MAKHYDKWTYAALEQSKWPVDGEQTRADSDRPYHILRHEEQHSFRGDDTDIMKTKYNNQDDRNKTRNNQ